MAYFRNVTLNIEDFDSEEEYSRALLEQERIQKILSNVDITDANVAKQLYDGFNEHPEMFRSRVGTEFMEVLKENIVGDDTPVQSVVNEQPQAAPNTDTENQEIENQKTDSQEIESKENNSEEAQDEEMVDTLTPELMKEAQAEDSQTPQEAAENEEAATQEDMAEQSLQEAEAQALWEQPEEEIQAEEVDAEATPQEATEEQSLQEAQEQSLNQELSEQQEVDNEDNSDDYIADSNEAEARAIKEESELVKPEVLHMEKPQILKKISASVNSINNTDIDNNNNITDNNLDNNQDNIINDTKKDKINNNKSVQKSVQKIKTDRPELTYIGLIRWVLIIAPFVIISFPMAGAILSGICALYAFIKVWGAYINDKMKPVDILKALLYIVLFPVGIVMSVFGIMKKIKYVYYNRKAILYSFIIYLIPVIFFCNVGLISSNNMVSLLLPIINVFLNATLVGRIAVILDVIVVAIVIICIASSFSKKVAILIYDYIDKGMTQAQALQFIICLPIVVICMFKAFIDGKVLYEDKIVK